MSISPLSALWAGVLVNSLVPIFAFWGAGSIDPVFFALAGSAIGFLALSPWALGRGYLRLFFGKEYFLPLLVIGFFGSALPIILLVYALNYTTPSNAAVLSQVEVVYSVLLSALFLRERITGKQLLGSALVLAGTMAIIFKERFTVRFAGDLLVLLVPFSYQISHLFSKKLKRGVSHVFVASARTFFASVSMAVIFFFYALSGKYGQTLSGREILILLFWGVILTALNNVLWYRAILNLDLAKATAIILSYPVFTTLISAALGLEKILPYQVLGLALALSGALMVTSVIRKQAD